MRILCVIPSYWPAFQFGGPIFSLHKLNKALVEKGIDISVYTTNAGIEKRVPLNEEVDIDRVKVTYFSYARLFQFLGSTGWHFSKGLARALNKNIRAFDLIYIVAIWNYPVSLAAYYSRRNKKPYIISPRGLLYPYARRKKFWRKWVYYNFITKKDLRGASAMHYTSDDEEKACHASLGLKNQAFVIPNGIDLTEFSHLPKREIFRERYPVLGNKKVLFFLGRINWKKGLDILVPAYSKLASERDDVHLLIAGSDEAGYIKKVKSWIKRYGLEGKVTFTGMLVGRDKLAAYAASDIFVLPSYSENFGLAAVEAMACGVPVIISHQVGISREIKENNAGLVVECNVDSLYKAMQSLLDDQNLRGSLSLNAQEMAKKYYNIDNVAEAMARMYQEIIYE